MTGELQRKKDAERKIRGNVDITVRESYKKLILKFKGNSSDRYVPCTKYYIRRHFSKN